MFTINHAAYTESDTVNHPDQLKNGRNSSSTKFPMPAKGQPCEQALLKTAAPGTSLVAQWLRIHLPMQGTRVRSLVQEDPTCRGATKPVRHNY